MPEGVRAQPCARGRLRITVRDGVAVHLGVVVAVPVLGEAVDPLPVAARLGRRAVREVPAVVQHAAAVEPQAVEDNPPVDGVRLRADVQPQERTARRDGNPAQTHGMVVGGGVSFALRMEHMLALACRRIGEGRRIVAQSDARKDLDPVLGLDVGGLRGADADLRIAAVPGGVADAQGACPGGDVPVPGAAVGIGEGGGLGAVAGGGAGEVPRRDRLPVHLLARLRGGVHHRRVLALAPLDGVRSAQGVDRPVGTGQGECAGGAVIAQQHAVTRELLHRPFRGHDEGAGQSAYRVAVAVRAAVPLSVQNLEEKGRSGAAARVRVGLQGAELVGGRHPVERRPRLEGRGELIGHVDDFAGDAAAGLKGPAQTRHAGNLVYTDPAAAVLQGDGQAQLAPRKLIHGNRVLGQAETVGEGNVRVPHRGGRLRRGRQDTLGLRGAALVTDAAAAAVLGTHALGDSRPQACREQDGCSKTEK